MTTDSWVVTGGAGYIGAHVVQALREAGRRVVVVDDLSTGAASRLPGDVDLEQLSVLETERLTRLLGDVGAVGVVHLAGKKSPTESMSDPLLYARENVGGVVSLAQAVRDSGARQVVFSSSCSVYGSPDLPAVDEDAPTLPQSPYGESKLYGERVLAAAARAHGIGVTSLRYFNVVGAAGPALRDTGAYNLVPMVFRALREGTTPLVFGDDYPTPDGTCVRDYVDVRDLADAHSLAAAALQAGHPGGTYNVGRGAGYSVLEVLDTVRAVTGRPLLHEVVARRPGDPGSIVGSVTRIGRELGWTATRDLSEMITSAWDADPG
ncbi:UDP-glucose 4-epimerase GalE [Modestobacter muralis]|uniref:UDP-glucose 4-epimerase n=1 Tax=Modestobacter muralis TaxID=1608614 RepID=A0A6P0ETN4_9ACTN|nr:UDP-glucose 4-epimerase GalE [Modestobacter muralis]NEK94487.1 UDP-glucose 4-epimerase GalE [Modestobacter muralis]NEN51375.1 UDP-glucose 4-epimerase GalE [Modestobacter muralis]